MIIESVLSFWNNAIPLWHKLHLRSALRRSRLSQWCRRFLWPVERVGTLLLFLELLWLSCPLELSFAVHSRSAFAWTLIASPGKTCHPGTAYCILLILMTCRVVCLLVSLLSHFIYRLIELGAMTRSEAMECRVKPIGRLSIN